MTMETVPNPALKEAKQAQIESLLFTRSFDWKDVIYDLIYSAQLDPWDVDLVILTEKYLEKIQSIEDLDFFVSSNVLLAAALLLKIKSELLVNKYIRSIDEILFGKKEDKKYVLERIELDEAIPSLVPKSPIPRLRKVTLEELINSLSKAITTENRRIKKELVRHNSLREVEMYVPQRKTNLKDQIDLIYTLLFGKLSDGAMKTLLFSTLKHEDKTDRALAFISLLHLEHQQRVVLEQQTHFGDISVWLREIYLKHNATPLAQLKTELAPFLDVETIYEEEPEKE